MTKLEQRDQAKIESEMKITAILHMAKKNLCFEMEYIQAVIEKLEGKTPGE
jgi:GTP-sensing pleiotropic transcriptional regulator CodY